MCLFIKGDKQNYPLLNSQKYFHKLYQHLIQNIHHDKQIKYEFQKSLKTTIAEDQMENHQQSFKSMERISICQPFSSKEFFNRQKLYDDLYNTNQIKCESLNSIRLEKGMKQSKYKDIVESAKLKHAQSPNNISNSIMKLQQNSITDIVEQLRNQKKANNVKLQSSVNNLKKQQQLNLNLILIIAIPLLCCLVVIFEMARIKEQNTN